MTLVSPEISASDAPCAVSATRAGEAAAVWALFARRPGDNAQIEALAQACSLPFAVKRLAFRKGLEALPNVRPGGSLFSLTAASQAELAAPYPAVVIAAGKRSAAAALAIKRASGGRTKLVHLGRTFAPTRWFDLVISTPQYRLPDRPNLVQNLLPLTRAPQAVAELDADLAALPRPRTLVVAGGSAAPLVFSAETARALVREALASARAEGGSLMVATSPRTSRAAVSAIREALAGMGDVPVRLSVFGDGPNRYQAFLAAADRVVVTDDSVSMATEAAMTGAPVNLFALPSRAHPQTAVARAVERAFSGSRAGRAAFEALIDFGLVTSNRDLGAFSAMLRRNGLLDGGPAARDQAARELADAVARIRSLAGY